MSARGDPKPALEADRSGDPEWTEALEWLRRTTGEIPDLRLVILDPQSRFAGLDAETDNASGTAFIQACESIANATGANVLVTVHTNKLSRGSGKVVETSDGPWLNCSH